MIQHDLRHRRVTTWLAEGKNPVHVKEALGHADLRTTMGYTHLVRERLHSLVESEGVTPTLPSKSDACLAQPERRPQQEKSPAIAGLSPEAPGGWTCASKLRRSVRWRDVAQQTRVVGRGGVGVHRRIEVLQFSPNVCS